MALALVEHCLQFRHVGAEVRVSTQISIASGLPGANQLAGTRLRDLPTDACPFPQRL